ncbi:MAG: dTDP-4-dehydrorhamnose reductase [Armatimonadota bacterium]|nr:dTDP-4-dehydrorhamnose reductase [Armatimonadota bacterium]
MQVVVIGAGGLLGQDIVKDGKRRGWTIVTPGREQLDVTDESAMAGYFGHARPAWIINCAAFVAVDDAECSRNEAFVINSEGALYAARASLMSGARLVHISTDYVFDGRKKQPYTEDDEVNPLGVYAASKLQGERNVLATNPSAIVARSAWLYGVGRANFPSKILDTALKGKALRIVSDRVGSPTYTPDLAKGIGDIMEFGVPGGIYHVVNSGAASWYDLVKEMLRAAGVAVPLEPASTEEYPTPAERPAYSVLSTEKLRLAGVEILPPWQDAVGRFVRELRSMGVLPA